MEVASPSTWERDAAEKRDIYANMGVTEYWRFDPTGEHFTPELVGETLVEGQYRLPLEYGAAAPCWGWSCRWKARQWRPPEAGYGKPGSSAVLGQ